LSAPSVVKDTDPKWSPLPHCCLHRHIATAANDLPLAQYAFQGATAIGTKLKPSCLESKARLG
jgi:hypothetical protein